MTTALRVLTTITERKTPDAADVQFLLKYDLPSEAKLPADELATEIIKRELVRRKQPKK